jgi:hypothetical protein
MTMTYFFFNFKSIEEVYHYDWYRSNYLLSKKIKGKETSAKKRQKFFVQLAARTFKNWLSRSFDYFSPPT